MKEGRKVLLNSIMVIVAAVAIVLIIDASQHFRSPNNRLQNVTPTANATTVQPDTAWVTAVVEVVRYTGVVDNKPSTEVVVMSMGIGGEYHPVCTGYYSIVLPADDSLAATAEPTKAVELGIIGRRDSHGDWVAENDCPAGAIRYRHAPWSTGIDLLLERSEVRRSVLLRSSR